MNETKWKKCKFGAAFPAKLADHEVDEVGHEICFFPGWVMRIDLCYKWINGLDQ